MPAIHAPWILKRNGLFHMVYGPTPIRYAESKDLSHWTPKGNLQGTPRGRDLQVFVWNHIYHLIVCGVHDVRVATSRDFRTWTERGPIRQLEVLPDYETAMLEDGPIVANWKDADANAVPVHNVASPTVPVFPAEQITRFSPPGEKALFERTLRWIKHNGNNSHFMVNVARARLSMPEAYMQTRAHFSKIVTTRCRRPSRADAGRARRRSVGDRRDGEWRRLECDSRRYCGRRAIASDGVGVFFS